MVEQVLTYGLPPWVSRPTVYMKRPGLAFSRYKHISFVIKIIAVVSIGLAFFSVVRDSDRSDAEKYSLFRQKYLDFLSAIKNSTAPRGQLCMKRGGKCVPTREDCFNGKPLVEGLCPPETDTGCCIEDACGKSDRHMACDVISLHNWVNGTRLKPYEIITDMCRGNQVRRSPDFCSPGRTCVKKVVFVFLQYLHRQCGKVKVINLTGECLSLLNNCHYSCNGKSVEYRSPGRCTTDEASQACTEFGGLSTIESIGTKKFMYSCAFNTTSLINL